MSCVAGEVSGGLFFLILLFLPAHAHYFQQKQVAMTSAASYLHWSASHTQKAMDVGPLLVRVSILRITVNSGL